MDPRIKARHEQVSAQHRRRRLLFLGAAVLMVGIVVAGSLVLTSPVFAVRTVEVRGVGNAHAGEVRAAAKLGSRPLMLGLDSGGVIRRVRALPWVATAAVRESWPSTVVLLVTVRVPVGQVALPGRRWALVDRTGRVLGWADRKRQGLVVLKGLGAVGGPGSQVERSSAVEVASRLPTGLQRQVSQITAGRGGGVSMTVAPGVSVGLGQAGDLAAKFEALATLERRVGLNNVKAVDLTVPAYPALTPG